MQTKTYPYEAATPCSVRSHGPPGHYPSVPIGCSSNSVRCRSVTRARSAAEIADPPAQSATQQGL